MKILNSLIAINKWLKLFIGTLICVALFFVVADNDLDKSMIFKQLIIPLALPGAFALMGLLEIVSGVPFQNISDKWDSLKGWQTGVLGLSIAVVAIISVIYSMAFFLPKS